jgi:hypothetical protein
MYIVVYISYLIYLWTWPLLNAKIKDPSDDFYKIFLKRTEIFDNYDEVFSSCLSDIISIDVVN